MQRCAVSVERESADPAAGGAEPVPHGGENRLPLSTVGSGKPCEVVDKQQSNRRTSATTGGGSQDQLGDLGPAEERNTGFVATTEPAAEDLARAALSQAQYITKVARPRKSRRRASNAGRRRDGYSGAAPDDLDPQRAGAVLGGLLDERGWRRPLAEARVFADWASIVGPDIAAHCQPSGLQNGELRIAAESTAWATQLRLMASALLASLVRELGPHTVTKVFITGPVGPTWKHGPRAVRDGRGPRDTYG
jgi:predicted nucleic acid-binding Zn ribbon protein